MATVHKTVSIICQQSSTSDGKANSEAHQQTKAVGVGACLPSFAYLIGGGPWSHLKAQHVTYCQRSSTSLSECVFVIAKFLFSARNRPPCLRRVCLFLFLCLSRKLMGMRQ
ncbi:hypothetical protein CDAR_585651 [Caerostris darwini]|uniref:Uncharacterized protein n=1 Tax=Caerostris darwini TaxID=1538125 RepID=A0AAV4TKX5_9ARAC|nr:hypothetical protein CDAR_585651 [Caerostris darwini]